MDVPGWVSLLVGARRVLRFFFFSSRRRHTRLVSDWSSDVCSSDLEISTDKVDAEVPAPASGTLVSIAAEADETVQVGSVLGEIDPDGDGPAPAVPDEEPPADS